MADHDRIALSYRRLTRTDRLRRSSVLRARCAMRRAIRHGRNSPTWTDLVAPPIRAWGFTVLIIIAFTAIAARDRYQYWMAVMVAVPMAWCARRWTLARRNPGVLGSRGERLFALFSFAWPLILISATLQSTRACVHTHSYFVGPIGLVHSTIHGVPLDSTDLGGDWYLVVGP
jgi:hypothetical protein